MDSFILYTNYSKHLRRLTHEQKGKLLDALFSFAQCGEPAKLDPLTDMAFDFIKEDIEINNAKWLQTKDKRKLSGQKGGLAKASKTKQSVANVAVSVNENVNANVNENVNADIPPKKKTFDHDTNAYIGAKLLDEKICERMPSKQASEATLQKWADSFDKLHRIDGYDWGVIEDVLLFSQNDKFWKTIILTGAKFRDKFVSLMAKMGDK